MLSTRSAQVALPVDKRLSNTTLSLIGSSRAGDGTSLLLPEPQLLVDCGALFGHGCKAPRRIFVTHCHSDHVQFLARYVMIHPYKEPLEIYIPAQSEAAVKAHLHAYRRLVECDHKDTDEDAHGQTKSGPSPFDNYQLIPLQAHQEVMEIVQKSQHYKIQAIECHHRTTCFGYAIYKQQSVLRPEYKGKSGREIGELRKQGVLVTKVESVPLVVILGDTTHQVLLDNPHLATTFPTVVIECTFLPDDASNGENSSGDKDLERAARTKHMHWQNLRPYVESNPHTLFVLTHFSLKYSALRIRKFFRNVPNVHPFIRQDEVQTEWNKKMAAGEVSDGASGASRCGCFQCQADRSK